MKDLVGVVALVATTVTIYTVLYLGLRQVGRGPYGSRGVSADHPRREPRPPGPALGSVPSYREVGSWVGGRYPPRAVVVGYDGKKHSRAAVAWSAHEAARRGAPLLVLHAAHYPGMTGEPGPGLHHRDPDALQAAEEVTARGVAEAVSAHPGITVVGATEVTSAAEALTQASEGAALTVVGSRGHGRFLRALRHSVASEAAARASSPVVVVSDRVAPAPATGLVGAG